MSTILTYMYIYSYHFKLFLVLVLTFLILVFILCRVPWDLTANTCYAIFSMCTESAMAGVITLISSYVDIDSMSPTLTHCWLLSISTFKEIRTGKTLQVNVRSKKLASLLPSLSSRKKFFLKKYAIYHTVGWFNLRLVAWVAVPPFPQAWPTSHVIARFAVVFWINSAGRREVIAQAAAECDLLSYECY